MPPGEGDSGVTDGSAALRVILGQGREVLKARRV